MGGGTGCEDGGRRTEDEMANVMMGLELMPLEDEDEEMENEWVGVIEGVED